MSRVAPCLSGFILLLVGFSGALLVVLVLGMVCDCPLWLLLRSWEGLLVVSVGAMGLFWPGMALSGLCPRSGAWRVRASPSGIYPAGGLERHFSCGLSFGHGL